jgi:hypothetical protein
VTIQAADWRVTEQGHAQVTWAAGQSCLSTRPSDSRTYSNAQISDYAEADFRWRPPLRLDVRAHFSSNLPIGTAGFGFWNHPFAPGDGRLRLPQAIWFFYSSPPNNMALSPAVPGPGWKAATINARRWQFLLLAPTMPLALLLMRVPALYRRLWPNGQRAIGVSEALLDPALLSQSHDYRLDWRSDGASLYVDAVLIHESPYAPGGPLGFVAWIDNQYAIVTPQGRFGFGLVPIEAEQSLTIEQLSIAPC